jgi:hypothetical protein
MLTEAHQPGPSTCRGLPKRIRQGRLPAPTRGCAPQGHARRTDAHPIRLVEQTRSHAQQRGRDEAEICECRIAPADRFVGGENLSEAAFPRQRLERCARVGDCDETRTILFAEFPKIIECRSLSLRCRLICWQRYTTFIRRVLFCSQSHLRGVGRVEDGQRKRRVDLRCG